MGNTPYFVYERAPICNLFLFLMVKSMAVEEGKKLLNWYNVSIVSKFYIRRDNNKADSIEKERIVIVHLLP